MVPKNFSRNQKDVRRKRCIDLLKSVENDHHFSEHVIIGDKAWVFVYDPETKH